MRGVCVVTMPLMAARAVVDVLLACGFCVIGVWSQHLQECVHSSVKASWGRLVGAVDNWCVALCVQGIGHFYNV